MAMQLQDAVVAALEKLGLEREGSSMPGATVKLKVTEKTVKHIQSLVDKAFEVDSQGDVTEEY
jgi:hypothetical protein